MPRITPTSTTGEMIPLSVKKAVFTWRRSWGRISLCSTRSRTPMPRQMAYQGQERWAARPVSSRKMAVITWEKAARARAVSGPDTIQLGEDFPSRCAVLVDLDTRTVLAEKNADTVISPASMTKVLTVLVAAEHITEAELDDTFTMTIDITDYCYVNGCSVVGLMVDETVPVRELFYGTILSSGADAALGLATYVAGSQEAFVALASRTPPTSPTAWDCMTRPTSARSPTWR